MLNGLDLFSGIGGISLALAPWVRPVAYCESDRYAQSVLLSRMREGWLPAAPIWDDVRTLTAGHLPPIDIITGGFPCQDISTAGLGAGLEGKRSGLFFDIIRLAGDLRPTFVFLENVPAISVRGLDRVLLEFTSLGYDTRWTTISAASVGANHSRDRWFLLAYSGDGEALADSSGIGSGERTGEGCGPRGQDDPMRDGWWSVEPNVGRVANGIPRRVDRIRGLGNAVVPKQARKAFKRLGGIA